MERFLKTFLSVAALVVFSLTVYPFSAFAIKTEKVTLNGDMTIDYNELPQEAETFSEAFSQGIFYGRFRTNIFYYDYDSENYASGGSKMDHKAMGIGGSMIFKSAPFKGFSTTLGLYTSQNPSFFREDKEDVGYVKTGKDTFSRNQVKNGGEYDGHFGMTVPGQVFIQYDVGRASVIAGRQLYESLFTASNDTKMIPNTFDGISANFNLLPYSSIHVAYFTAQKLRDHLHSHDVIAYSSWDENDDSVANKSVTKDLAGADNELIIVSASTKAIKNLNITAGYLYLPNVLSQTVFEANYSFPIEDWSITPGMRMMFQNDHLNADLPVANLNASTNAYVDPNDLDGKLYAARVDLKNGPLSFRLGYSKISDDADIISPWRGFPTSGYTRAMGQYNWNANTKSFMFRIDYDFDKAKLIPGMKVLVRYVIQDFDDLKTGVQPDSNVFHMDITQVLTDNLELKLRFLNSSGNKNTHDINGSLKSDISYTEYRLELNYFF